MERLRTSPWPFGLGRLRAHLGRPVDGASLAIFRVLFGLLMAYGASRYVAEGWIEKYFVGPSFHFRYYGFGWLPELTQASASLTLGVLFVSSLLVAAGLLYRLSAAVMLVSFALIEFSDVTIYLNHHYLAGLLAALLLVLPANRVWSLDALIASKRGRPYPTHIPFAAVWVLRFQLAVVYFYAALAKFGPDWLLSGQPLGLWLSAMGDRPLIGPLLSQPLAPLVLSWGGFLYDLTIWAFLLKRQTRPYAYGVVLVFHTFTRVLFNIGLFPWIMSTATLMFFDPDWPRRVWRYFFLGGAKAAPTIRPDEPGARPPIPVSHPQGRAVTPAGINARPFSCGWAWALGAYAALQLLMPLRHLAYPGDVLWGEQGMRWSWRVMVREKSASVMFIAVGRETGKRRLVAPEKFVTPHQYREMGGQPDLLLQAAHHIGGVIEKRWGEPVALYADTWISFNGRRRARFLKPEVDLMAVADGLGPAEYIASAPGGAPPPGRGGHRVFR